MNLDAIPGLVSTIIPVFNRPSLLREAVESVLGQNYWPIQVIIVDDGSDDGETLLVARELVRANPSVVQVATQTNAGPGAARERGRLLAQGEFVQYLDCDDLLLPGKFEAQVRALRENPRADVAYGITYFRDASGTLIEVPHKGTGQAIGTMFPRFLNERWWDTSTPLYRASVCARAGSWMSLRIEEDWEYDCRIASFGGTLAWCPVPVCVTCDHAGIRLSRGRALDAGRLRHRAMAQESILAHALKFGLTPADREMQVFSRSLFLLARQCGAGGLVEESRRLFDLARQAAGVARSRGMDFRFYSLFASACGWATMGRVSCLVDKLRRAQ